VCWYLPGNTWYLARYLLGTRYRSRRTERANCESKLYQDWCCHNNHKIELLPGKSRALFLCVSVPYLFRLATVGSFLCKQPITPFSQLAGCQVYTIKGRHCLVSGCQRPWFPHASLLNSSPHSPQLPHSALLPVDPRPVRSSPALRQHPGHRTRSWWQSQHPASSTSLPLRSLCWPVAFCAWWPSTIALACIPPLSL